MRLILIFISASFLFSCSESEGFFPKPRIYPRVDYPVKTFVTFSNPECPFSMVIPKYYQYTKDSLKNDNEKRFNCWFDLYSHELNSNIHFSYFTFSGRQEYDALVQDAFEMANKHNVKASFRNEFSIQYPLNNVYGLMFDIEGPVASPMQFYLTDSTSHFLRGSLYFNDIVNRDSIAPIYNFIKEDFGPLFKSFKWTD